MDNSILASRRAARPLPQTIGGVAARHKPELGASIVVHALASICVAYLLGRYSAASFFAAGAVFWLIAQFFITDLAEAALDSGLADVFSNGFAVSAAAMMLFNPLVAAVIVSLGTLQLADLTLRRWLWQSIYNRSIRFVAAASAALAFDRLPVGQLAIGASIAQAIRVVALVAVFLAVDTLLQQVLDAAREGRPFSSAYSLRADLFLSYAVQAGLAIGIASLTAWHAAWTLAAIVPLCAAYATLARTCRDSRLAPRVSPAGLGSSEPVDLGDASTTGPRLTRREAQILGLVGFGLTTKQIVVQLGIKAPTVERHVSNLYAKIGVRSRAEAAIYAVRLGVDSELVKRP